MSCVAASCYYSIHSLEKHFGFIFVFFSDLLNKKTSRNCLIRSYSTVIVWQFSHLFINFIWIYPNRCILRFIPLKSLIELHWVKKTKCVFWKSHAENSMLIHVSFSDKNWLVSSNWRVLRIDCELIKMKKKTRLPLNWMTLFSVGISHSWQVPCVVRCWSRCSECVEFIKRINQATVC